MYEIGKTITQLRKEHNISQAQLAKFLGVAPQSVSRWETESCYPDIELLPRIALFFDISMEELFGISSLRQVHQIVMKYSTVRNDENYEQAKRMIEREMNKALSQGNEEARKKLNEYALHLSIQRTRETMEESQKIMKRILEDKSIDEKEKLNVKMQKIQLDIQMGEGWRLLNQYSAIYKNCNNEENLLLYLNVLFEMYQYDQILKIANEEAVKEYLKREEASCDVWEFILVSAFYLKQEKYFVEFFENERMNDSLKFRINIYLLYAKLLKCIGNSIKLMEMKQVCENLLLQIDEEEEIYELFNKQIQRI